MEIAVAGHMTITTNIDHSNWRDAVLSIWRNHCGRTPTSSDIDCFRLILDASEAFVSDRLVGCADRCPPPSSAPLHVSEKFRGLSVLDVVPHSQLSASRFQANREITARQLQHITPYSAQTPSDDPGGMQRLSSRNPDLKHLPLRLHHAELASILPAQSVASQVLSKLPDQPRWGPSDIPVPPVTLAAISNDIQNRKQNGCKPFTHMSGFEEGYPCTLSCGRWLASSCDRRRHEETVFPRDYWSCQTCSSGHSSRKQFQFFHRLDKIQKHNRGVHDGQLDIDHCKIRNPPVLTPAYCGLCQYRFADRADRDDHIEKHHPRGKLSCQASIPIAESSRVAHAPSMSMHCPNPSAIVSAPTGLEQQWSLPHTMVILHRLAADSSKASQVPTEHLVAVQWLGGAVTNCGVAVSCRAEIAFDMRLGRVAEPRTYVVKQYRQSHKAMYEQEIAAHLMVAARSDNGGITKCSGVFEGVDNEGIPTYNILLDCSQHSLWTYWMKSSPPRTFAGIQSFYKELFSLAIGLDSLQGLRETTDRGSDCILRGDLRPENIHAFSQQQAELANKFRFDMLYQPCTITRLQAGAGRRAWRRVFIVLVWFGCNSKLDLICTVAATSPDYGKPVLKLSTVSAEPTITGAEQNSVDGSTDNFLEKVRRAEMLAFSCVLTLAATWMAMGQDGLLILERNPLPQIQVQHVPPGSSRQCPVHVASVPTVSTWHQHLMPFISREDTVTPRLLHFLDQHLYQLQSAHHLHISGLKTELDRILQQAETIAVHWGG
ncbi:uncharacterized protein M421DRAFT_412650 [Didymella exigua CBS 183.55]|uniref:Uncharacterized protein n=1 Tax=Didymella exigua CBS 183.55 TaxID=1150837 RepID=A0A6A5RS55_9PLEO|nr:uncharacterized protein M421DRAFT_412650 [Didymella exigua CBS 183.55]KAF1930439.1 hypothetical protein M421DRAFT_412650 [Didymella exigua CBS 183.55]